MYDDLVTDLSNIKRKLKEAVGAETCPNCGSTNIEASYGTFISKIRYVQTMVCMACSAQWDIVYDSDLNVIDVDTGG